jgi:hypothetical protein
MFGETMLAALRRKRRFLDGGQEDGRRPAKQVERTALLGSEKRWSRKQSPEKGIRQKSDPLFRRRRARSGTSKTKLETKLVHRALTATTSELAPQVVWQKTAALCQWKLWARKKTTRYLTQLLFG